MHLLKLVAAAALAFMVTACAGAIDRPAAVTMAGAPNPGEFRRGINILGYDPIWKDPAKARSRSAILARYAAEASTSCE